MLQNDSEDERMIYAIIGSNYGDEGKGLATDYFTSQSDSALVVRHNGGAQSGHTVEIKDKRFVFHELSAGSFRGADTYWADTFFPDLFKLGEEIERFRQISEIVPQIYASPEACMTTIDDVLLNMLLESSRKEKRHGSCGMGINEAFLRGKAGFGYPLARLVSRNASEFYHELLRIRKEYTFQRVCRLGLTKTDQNEYYDLLTDDSVLYNFAESVFQNLRYMRIEENKTFLFEHYDDIIFESGQGLRLDAEYKENWPHVTASRTGLTNVFHILKECGKRLDEAVYVTRSYITKHGAGPLKNESAKLASMFCDRTNVCNPWQGDFRYARFESVEELVSVILSDLKSCPYPVKAGLFMTHLNETNYQILLAEKDFSIMDLCKNACIQDNFDEIFLSDSCFSDRVFKMEGTAHS